MEDNCFQTKFFDEASDHLLGFVVVSVHDEDFSASIKLHWREITFDFRFRLYRPRVFLFGVPSNQPSKRPLRIASVS